MAKVEPRGRFQNSGAAKLAACRIQAEPCFLVSLSPTVLELAPDSTGQLGITMEAWAYAWARAYV